MDSSYTNEAAAEAVAAGFMGMGAVMLVVILVNVVLPPFVTMFCARSRSRGMIRWFLIGLFLSWFGPLLVLLLGHTVAGEAKRNVNVSLREKEIAEKAARRQAEREARTEEKAAKRQAKVARRQAELEAKMQG